MSEKTTVDKMNLLLSSMEEKIEKRDSLLVSLKQSLALRELCPDAWDYKSKPTSYFNVVDEELVVSINGERRVFPLQDVPRILVPEHVLEKMDWREKRKARLKEHVDKMGEHYYER